MRLYEASTAYIIGGVLVYLLYAGITAEEIENKQTKTIDKYKKVKKELVSLKSNYMKKRNKCRVNDSWKDNSKCDLIKEVDPKAERLWNLLEELDKELKRANTEVERVQDLLRVINSLKSVVTKI